MKHYFKKSELLLLRDWTPWAVDKFLGKPCKRLRNPKYPNRPQCLFAIDRVLKIEASNEWQEWHINKSRKLPDCLIETDSEE